MRSMIDQELLMRLKDLACKLKKERGVEDQDFKTVRDAAVALIEFSHWVTLIEFSHCMVAESA